MPLQATSGAASQDAFGGGAPAALPTYIEDVFSTYLYTGNSSTQTITNGIDLSTKGGLVWIKRRTSEAHYLFDTSRGALVELNTDGTDANQTKANSLTAFNTTGFSLGSFGGPNYSVAPDNSYVSWTFRKQPKFFDIQTWTGTGSNTTISHALGSVPACIIVKRTDTTSDWQVYHRSLANTEYLVLNSTAAKATGATRWNSTTPTSSVFSLGTDATVNASGGTYVAYLFAHDAGGFGLSGTDNVISCGSYTGDGSTSGPVVTLGYEPQWLLVKRSSAGANDWILFDNMRGMPVGSADSFLRPNTSQAEDSLTDYVSPTATGFNVVSASSNVNTNTNTYIYIAIRRGPMKVPTTGTSVYMGTTRTGNGAVTALTAAGFPPDLYWAKSTAGVRDHAIFDRLRGPLPLLSSNNTQNEIAYTDDLVSFGMTGVTTGTDGSTNAYNQNGVAYVNWYMRRAPSFFDEVCFTVSGSVSLTHNLTVRPELVIYKTRGSADSWWTCANVNGVGQLNNNGNWAFTGTGNGLTDFAQATSTTIGNLNGLLLSSGNTVVAYLFATCPGVSKCGSYTGTGTTQTINCGFTGGARFVLIKRTDSTGDWYVWDSARGIIAGNDPYLLFNSTAAEVTSTDYIDTYSAGFEISSTAPAAINASGGSFIFLAIS